MRSFVAALSLQPHAPVVCSACRVACYKGNIFHMFTNFLHMRLHKIVSLVVDNMFDTAKTHHENLLCNALIERFTLKPSRKIYNFLGFLFWIQA